MRRIAWWLLLGYAFAIPWEYSLDMGSPLGNAARVMGVLLLLVAVPAVLQSNGLRRPGAMQWLALVLYLWFCCTWMWSIESAATFDKLRGLAQEMMVVWMVGEFAESPADLRWLLRAYIAGAWVLAALTLVSFGSAEAFAASQSRFVATGQDPNDVARFLDLSLPLAALLARCDRGAAARGLAWGYFPPGLFAVVLTASRGGFLEAMLALAGCLMVLVGSRARAAAVGMMAMPALAAAVWVAVPRATLERLATIPEQLQGGDLNMRLNLWHAGWQAFIDAPWAGHGVGAFAAASGTNAMDTAHQTMLSILVGSGLVGLFLVSGIAVLAVWEIFATRGPIRIALLTALLVWGTASMVSTLEESRATWLLLGLIALAGRLAREKPEQLAACFSEELASADSGGLTALRDSAVN